MFDIEFYYMYNNDMGGRGERERERDHDHILNLLFFFLENNIYNIFYSLKL